MKLNSSLKESTGKISPMCNFELEEKRKCRQAMANNVKVSIYLWDHRILEKFPHITIQSYDATIDALGIIRNLFAMRH